MTDRSRLALPLALCALAGCRSAPEAGSKASLPFHVAIAPFAARPAGATVPKGEEGLVLVLDGAETAQVLAKTLESEHFAKTTLLVEAAAEPGAEATEVERNLRRMRAARAAGADLLMTCDLEYDPNAETEINDKFWLNLPLFLLGGPATWFVADRDYEPQARLVFRVYDVSAVEASALAQDAAGDPLASRDVVLLEREAVEPQQVTMNFLDRAGKSGGWYVVSVFWPSGFLVPKSDTASERLGGWVVEDLCAAAAAQLRAREAEILRPLSAPFFLGKEAAARRLPDGRVDLSARLFLKSRDASNLGTCTVFADRADRPVASIQLDSDSRVIDEDESTAAPRPVYRYEISTPLDVPADARALRLEVKDRGSPARLRSFTLPIEGNP